MHSVTNLRTKTQYHQTIDSLRVYDQTTLDDYDCYSAIRIQVSTNQYGFLKQKRNKNFSLFWIIGKLFSVPRMSSDTQRSMNNKDISRN